MIIDLSNTLNSAIKNPVDIKSRMVKKQVGSKCQNPFTYSKENQSKWFEKSVSNGIITPIKIQGNISSKI